MIVKERLTVPERIPENEVQVGVFLSVQPPEEVHVTPAALNLASAWAWVRGVPVRGRMTAAAEATIEARTSGII
jgi:hypothetical protein